MPAPTPDDLWEAQLREHPRSMPLDPHTMLAWAEVAKTSAGKLDRYRLLAQPLRFKTVVFYMIPPPPGAGASPTLGCRYGTGPHEYLSGFDFV